MEFLSTAKCTIRRKICFREIETRNGTIMRSKRRIRTWALLFESVPHFKWNKSNKTGTYTWEDIRIHGTRNEQPRSVRGCWLASPINTRRVRFVVKYYSLIISDENLPTFTLRMSIRSASIKLPRRWQISLLKMVISRDLLLYGKLSTPR